MNARRLRLRPCQRGATFASRGRPHALCGTIGSSVAHLAVSAVYLLSRALLYGAGFPFVFNLDWMWLPDAGDLKERLAETLLYYHAFPPGIDLMTGLLLKLDEPHAALLARGVFAVVGLTLSNLLLLLGRAAGLGSRAAATTAIAFIVSPPAIFLEHLYHYEWPDVTLVVASAVLFHRACLAPTFARWLAFFAVCATLSLTRSTFHLIWIAALVPAAIAAGGRGTWRRVLAASAPALLLVVAVYAKNALLFGEFAASTFGPASLHLVTVDRMPADERDRWIAEGRLSPFAAISAYAPPRAYLRYFESSERPGWPPQVNQLEHPHVQAPNYNHWILLEVHRARAADARAYLSAYPGRYLRTAWDGLIALLGPTTEWHPRTGTPRSPHAGHREILGLYEESYNRLFHGLGFAPAGIYALLPLVLGISAWTALAAWRAGERARAALIVYAAAQVIYVLAVSSLATYLESSRYRFQVEPFIWVLAVGAVSSVAHARRRTE